MGHFPIMARNSLRTPTSLKFKTRLLTKGLWITLGSVALVAAAVWLLQPSPTDPPVYQVRKTPDSAYQSKTRQLTPAGKRLEGVESEIFRLRGLKHPSLQDQGKLARLERISALLKQAEDLELRLQWAQHDPSVERMPLQESLKKVYAEIDRVP